MTQPTPAKTAIGATPTSRSRNIPSPQPIALTTLEVGQRLQATLADTRHCFFGGLFPRIINGTEVHGKGVLAFTLPRLGEPMLARHLDADEFEVPDCSASVGGALVKPTAVVLADGLSASI